MHTDHEFEILGLSLDAKPEEVGPAYLARAKELTLIIQGGDTVAVSKAIGNLYALREAYQKALGASENLVVLLRNYGLLRSSDSTKEVRILTGLSFVANANERHLPMLEEIFCDENTPEPVRREAATKMHMMEDRSDHAHDGRILDLGLERSMLTESLLCDLTSYSNLSDATVKKMANALFLAEKIKDFAGSRILTRLLVKWHNTVLDHEQLKDALHAVAGDEEYTTKTRADAHALSINVAKRLDTSTKDAPRWRPNTLRPGPQQGGSKTPRPY